MTLTIKKLNIQELKSYATNLTSSVGILSITTAVGHRFILVDAAFEASIDALDIDPRYGRDIIVLPRT